MEKIFNYDHVITHRTIFHADDVFGVAMCKLINPLIKVSRLLQEDIPAVVESEKKLGKNVLVFDVGCEVGFPEYDHHQKEGKALRPEADGLYIDPNDGEKKRIPYCGFGLLWRDFGYRLCPDFEAWNKVDKTLVIGIDKTDNGVNQNLLSSSIKAMNPNWNDRVLEDDAFENAVTVAIMLLKAHADHANSAIAAKDEVLANYLEGEDIIVMDKYLPWADTVINDNRCKDVMFAIYPSQRVKGGYNVQTVPKSAGSMAKRMLFPKEWLGHADSERGIHFAHTSNYLIGCDSREQAIAVAKEAIERGKEEYQVAYSI